MFSFPFLFESNCVCRKKFINEGGRLVTDILHVSDVFKIKRSLVTIYIQEAFHPINYLFLITVLEKLVLEIVLLSELIYFQKTKNPA